MSHELDRRTIKIILNKRGSGGGVTQTTRPLQPTKPIKVQVKPGDDDDDDDDDDN